MLNNPISIAYQDSDAINQATYFHFFNYLRHIVLSIFEWENLPKTMNSRFLERVLMENGRAAMYKSEQTHSFINTLVTPASTLNYYNEPIAVHCYSNTINETMQYNEIAYVRNNDFELPSLPDISYFAQRLFTATRTADINLYNQRTTVMWKSENPNKKFSVANAIKQYDEFRPIVVGEEMGLTTEPLIASPPFITDKINDHIKNVWNEFLTYFGINSIPYYKKERMITGEAEANDEQLNYSLGIMLKGREEACEKFNSLYENELENPISVHVRNPIEKGESIIE